MPSLQKIITLQQSLEINALS